MNTQSVLKDFFNNEKLVAWVNRIVSFVLCLLMLIIVLAAFNSPIVTSGYFAIKPTDLLSSTVKEDLIFGDNGTLTLSYYLYKYFYLIFAVLAGVGLFLTVFCLLTNNKVSQRLTNYLMCALLIFLIVSMLIGFNYTNTYNYMVPAFAAKTSAYKFVIWGVIFLILKFTAAAVFNKHAKKEELKESPLSLASSFVQACIALIGLYAPLYIFPGTRYRMTGLDIILGKEDILRFLPMASAYRGFLVVMALSVLITFLLSIVFYVLNRRIFIQYYKYQTLLATVAIIIYALIGINYMLLYIDAGGFTEFFNTSMNTYSYLPLALMVLYWVGSTFATLTIKGLKVEYKVYSTPDENKKRRAVNPEAIAAAAVQNGAETVLDPVPAFSELDNRLEEFNADYQRRSERAFQDLTLPKLIGHVIDYARYSKERLSYGPVEIKSFVAGLAASKLSILQGMSGTGKTSLPKIFMESIDGYCDLVAVESSWRDKNELLGYYNEFNKKYTPKSFIQFLYKASLNKDIPFFIVLDEMNLSRIEYYFSDFLSLMESRENNRYIKLFDVQLYPMIDERENYLALRDGHTIDVPPNVWFIGTANRDESTFEISDKVYDRAQTINFDRRAPKIITGQSYDYPPKFVPYRELKRLFDEAAKTMHFDAESYLPIKRVEELLKPYKISFGNRVLKQIEDFVKAYVACSEISTDADRMRYIHEAVDCIMYSKVVRKLELKQVSDIDTLIEEFAALKLTKCEEFLQTLVEAV